MNNSWSRFLLGLASAILIGGATMHAIAFRKVAIAVQTSNLPPFFGNCLKALWIADSSTLMLIAALLTLLVLRPAAPGGAIAVSCGVLLATTASILYIFLGAFFAAHLLVAASAATLVACAVEKSHSDNLNALKKTSLTPRHASGRGQNAGECLLDEVQERVSKR